MMVHAPELSPQRVSVNVSLVDILPTLLELASIKPRESRDGTSLVNLLRRSPSAEDSLRQRLLFAHRAKHGEDHGRHIWAIIHENWKIIEDGPKIELFNHEVDFFEQENRIESTPLVAEKLQKRLAAFRSLGIQRPGESIEVELDEQMQNLLRKLGYVDDD